MLSSSGVPFLELVSRYLNFCRACTVTVVIFGHLRRSFYLLTYLLTVGYIFQSLIPKPLVLVV